MSGKTKIRSKIVNISDYKVIREIKNGAFGIVYLVEDLKTRQRLAAKVNISNSGSINDSMISREIAILIRIQSPTIIPFFGFSLKDFFGSSRVTILMEYKENGSLQELLEKERRSQAPHEYDNTVKQIILCGIAHGMMILHSRRVIHRDLKPDNVLLDSEYRPCITDFGLSKFLDPENTKSQSISGCGTTAYIAPEVFQSNHYSHKADVYSFGILMYEIITGEEAFSDIIHNKQTTIFNFGMKITQGVRPKFSRPIKPKMKKLIEQCWSHDPHKRPTFKEIFNKLSLSFDDDEMIESRLNDIVTGADIDEEEDFDSYPYCLEDVDAERVLDYVDDITSTQSTSALSKGNNYQQIVEELTKRVVELENQNQRKEEEIKKQKIAIRGLKKTILSSHVNNTLNVFQFPKLSRTYSQGIFSFLLINNNDFENKNTVIIKPFPDANNDEQTLNTIISDEKCSKAWCSKNDPNAYILFDFQNRSVCLNAIHMWTGDDPANGRHMKSIELSASNDGEEWTTPIKFPCYLNKPNTSSFAHIFMNNFWEDAFFRYIKLESSQPNYKGTNEIYLKRIEFFGQLQLNTNTNLRSAIDFENTFSIPKFHRDDSYGICRFLLYSKIDSENANNTIRITAFPDANGNQSTLNKIVVSGNEESWCSKDTPNAYIQFDFGKSSIAVFAIKIFTGDDPVNGRHMKTVIFYGSNDGQQWESIGQWSSIAINKPNLFDNLVLRAKNAHYYHFIKMQVLENYKGSNELYLKQIEFFGNVQRINK